MFKYGRKLEEERQYYEDLLARSEQKQTANLLLGLVVGAAAGYCTKKFIIPKLAEVEYKEKLNSETEALKERFSDLKKSVLNLKDKLHFTGCCCEDDFFDDECCCCDEECCEDDSCCDESCCQEGCCENEAPEAEGTIEAASEEALEEIPEEETTPVNQ